MKIPFFLALAALASGLLWAGQDAAARMDRCTDRHTIAYCQLIINGR